MIRQAVLRALEQARQTAPRAGIVLVAGLAAPLADGAPGDLDPTFGDAGRLGLEEVGPAWSLEMEDDGGGFLAGGDYYCYYYWGETCSASSFTQPFSNAGVPDLEYTHADLSGILILDAVRQPDGKVVGVGHTVQASTRSSLTVFRLMPDGARDSTFGMDGVVTYTSNGSVPHDATSVLLEPDGRIVVAGSHAGGLLVLRLLENGARDSSFGNDGVVLGLESASDARLARAPDGGYRITTQSDAFMTGKCRIVALTADGTRDQGFGPGGSVDAAPGVTGSAQCHDLAIQPDGRLLVAGTAFTGADSGGLLVRLLPDGTPDDSFSAPAVGQAMSHATALAVGAGGDVLVAGQGASDTAGALVARLKADGVLDTTYGNEGTTWIDLPSQWAQIATVYDMAATVDGSLTVSGSYGTSPGTAFAARLSGDGSADAAGVIGVTHTRIVASEGESQAVVSVRRAGGRAGAVSVAYRTAQGGGGSSDGDASAGSDYQEVTGQLSWADGDMADQEIVIPILADGPTPEAPETFLLEIDSIEGGAALGGQATRVEIPADGAPAGQFLIQVELASVSEGQAAEVWVERMFYGTGAVSVTVTPSGASTLGQDFDMEPTVLTWADGEQGGKFVHITAHRDSSDEEPFEELTLTLTDPTGGAILGARTTTTVQILDAASQPSGGGGGGGSFGWLSLLGLGAAGLRRFSRAV